MAGVQFGQQVDMNGFKVTEVAAGTDPTDAVNVSQLAAASPQGFADDIGDGVATTISVVHNFGTLDVIVAVFDKATNQDVMVDVDRVDVDTVALTFGTAPAADAYRVLVIPVP
jgi:ABC-type tungstate transport system permease subunit